MGFVPSATVLWFIGLLTASVSLLVGNKFIAEHYDAHNLTILFQNIVAALILWRGGKIGWFEIKPLQRSQFSKMAVTAVLNSLQLITSMNSLPYVAISTTGLQKHSTLLCAIIEM